MPVEAEPAPDQAVKMAGEIVGQVEGRRIGVVQGREVVDAGKEGVAMIARDPLDALGGEHPVEFAAGPAIAIGDQDAAIAVAGARTQDAAADGVGDLFGTVVQFGRNADDIDILEPGEPQRCHRLAHDRAAADHQGAGGPVDGRSGGGAGFAGGRDRLCRISAGGRSGGIVGCRGPGRRDGPGRPLHRGRPAAAATAGRSAFGRGVLDRDASGAGGAVVGLAIVVAVVRHQVRSVRARRRRQPGLPPISISRAPARSPGAAPSRTWRSRPRWPRRGNRRPRRSPRRRLR